MLSRRHFLLGAAACVTGSLTACSGSTSGEARQLNILNWADYLHPDAISEFERRYGIKVIYDTFASNEALMSKLQAGGTKYDIIVPSSYMVKQLKRLHLLDQLDHARIKGLDMLMPRFRNSLFDPGLKYCVPYTWGTTGIGYNLDHLSRLLRLPEHNVGRLSWDVFWDKRLSQRMTLLDDGREVIGMALKKSGHSYNSKDATQISAATRTLIEQKPLVMAYTSDQVIVELTSGDSFLSQVFSGDAYQARRENPQVRYVIPAQGASIWTDNFCIPQSAPHKDNAYLWINYMLEPAVAAACANFTHYATANWGAFKGVDRELKDDPNLYPPESILSSCEELEDIGSAIFVFDRMWTELKCS
ncbi:MAG: spermidine/putrescine ABC transporter substrate-binding protein [Candidatus Obscuribacter sp.]|jgi:spermidine/putrescine transport system substrate-binding protein|nr:spermidine/putrescine ABC transporter substrate-binding protein [Candidatus Obscuribacter sp.]